jgi:hypothetical protein
MPTPPIIRSDNLTGNYAAKYSGGEPVKGQYQLVELAVLGASTVLRHEI